MHDFEQLMRDDLKYFSPGSDDEKQFRGSVQGRKIHTFTNLVDFVAGGRIERRLPSGRIERLFIEQPQFRSGMGGIPDSWELVVRTEQDRAQSAHDSLNRVQPVVVTNSTNVQVGNNNSISLQDAVSQVVSKIDASTAGTAEKAEAKSRLAAFLKHPLVVSLFGAVLGGVADAMKDSGAPR
jgi:hypothetical protein